MNEQGANLGRTDGNRGSAGHHARRTPMTARGEPAVWLMGLALTVSLAAIALLVGLVAYEGARTFWPRPIHLVTLADGATGAPGAAFLGLPMKEEAYDPGVEAAAEIESLRQRGALPEGSLDADGRPLRRQYRVGNRELTGVPFRWVPLYEIASVETPPSAVLLERWAWGVWIGTPRALLLQDEIEVPKDQPIVEEERIESGGGRTVRVTRKEIDGPAGEGMRRVRERRYLAEVTPDDPEGWRRVWDAFLASHGVAAARLAQIRSLSRYDMGRVNDRINDATIEILRARQEALKAADGSRRRAGWGLWSAIAVSAFGVAFGAFALGRKARALEFSRPKFVVWPRAAWCVAALLLIAAWTERPWGEAVMTPQRLAEVVREQESRIEALQREYAEVESRIRELETQDARERVEFVQADGRFAPVSQSSLDEPMRVSQVVRAVKPNGASTGEAVGIYLARWGEFLSGDPRDANTEGGVFPVIFGTVMMTMLLSIIVVPFGIVAALYLREYARQGAVTSILRIAINNLAGVPSIVFGMFGLAFFCVTVGKYIDRGPEAPIERGGWWWLAAGTTILVGGALVMAVLARPAPGCSPQRRHAMMGWAVSILWVAAAALAVYLVAKTPYFDGFFSAKPGPTFGTRGILWASLTLALLTLPVVIVATEEAVAAVPRSMREGSYGCGASKWQTIRRIVLPGAMPGIMTGMILAMARGAGEVAPLMFVGAMKQAPKLPVSLEWPFLHAERSFMHLGFHIYDLGFQAPDSEAARPLVWTTTLLLLAIVVFLNLSAILIRARLRAKNRGSAV